MGRDKALVEIAGRALALRVAEALREAGARPVVAVGGDREALGVLGLVTRPDLHPGAGPLGGVLTALSGPGPEAVAVLGCDLRHPDPAAVRAVVDALGGDDGRPAAEVAVPVVAGIRQWHHAAWRRSARPEVEAAFERGARAPHEAAGTLRVAEVTTLTPAAVEDVDTPDDLPPP